MISTSIKSIFSFESCSLTHFLYRSIVYTSSIWSSSFQLRFGMKYASLLFTSSKRMSSSSSSSSTIYLHFGFELCSLLCSFISHLFVFCLPLNCCFEFPSIYFINDYEFQIQISLLNFNLNSNFPYETRLDSRMPRFGV